MQKKATKPAPKSLGNELDEALVVKKRAFDDLGLCDSDDSPKFIDAYARAANVVRQLEKDRRRAVSSFSDDELVAYIKALPERRREAFITAVQGASLAGKPLFG